MDADPLFEPLRLPSGLKLANRLVMAPIPTFAANADGTASEAELAYYRRRAQGGVAAVITAGCAVASDALAFPGQWRCDRDADAASLEHVARAVRDGGAEPILQLAHAGDPAASRDPVGAFRAAARRAAAAGFAAVEIHGGHRELLHRWLASGRRERCLETLEAVAEAGIPVWYRLDPEDDDRLDLAAAEAFVADAARSLDALDVSAKSYFAGSIRDPLDLRPRAALLAHRFPKLPVMAVGGLSAPQQALEALADGCALVGLGHALLADPDLPLRLRDGRWTPPGGPLSSDTLRAAAVPAPVIQYLLEKSRARR